MIPMKRRRQKKAVVVFFPDNNSNLVPGRLETEVIVTRHGHERRDKKTFGASLFDDFLVIPSDRKYISVPLFKSVVHLVDDRAEFIRRVITKENSQWVEDVTQYARIAKHTDPVRRV